MSIWMILRCRGGARLVVIVLEGHGIDQPGLPDAAGDDPQRPIRQRPLQLQDSSGGAVIQASTSFGVVKITGIAFGCMAPTSAFGSVVRNAKMSLVVSPSLTFRTDVQLVQMPAKQARGGSRRARTRCHRPRPC